MKKNLMLLISGLVAACTLSFAIPSVSAQQTNTPPHAGARRGGAEPHPAIHRAITALEMAKTDLQHADHDFGGHRAAALAECDKAIEQLREALKYDKK
jgi:hypothetical protein